MIPLRSRTLILVTFVFTCITAASGQAPSAKTPQQPSVEPQEQAPLPVFKTTVTVTANKREQEILDVGTSVGVITGDAIRELGLTSTTDLNEHAANVQLQDTFGGPGSSINLSIRGIGLNDFNFGTEANSVIYVDEFYIAPLAAGSMLLHDLERLEVLRGPQGTLFGRNTTGGLVHFVTKSPTPRNEAYGSLTVGSLGAVRFEGVGNLKLSDRVFARVSLLTDNSRGWMKNLGTGPDGYQKRLLSVRGQIRVEQSSWSWTAKYTHSKSWGNFSLRRGDIAEKVDERGFVVNGGPGPFLKSDVLRDFTLGQTNRPDHLDSNVDMVVSRIDRRVGQTSITAITGLLHVDQINIQDCDGTPLDSCFVQFPYRTVEMTQEVRATGAKGRTRWTTGAFFMGQNARSSEAAALDIDGFFGKGVPGFGFGGPFILDVHSQEHKRAGAVFGQIEEELGHGVVMTFGSRLSRDDKNFEMLKRDYAGVPGNTITDRVSYANLYPGVYIEGIGGNVNFTRNGPPLPISTQFNLIPDTLLPPAGDLTHRADNLVDARIGVTWHAAEKVTTYASFSRGTKAGGFNNGLVSAMQNSEVPFGPEANHAIEGGLKAELGRSTRLLASVFHYRYANYQAVAFERLGTHTINRDARLSGGEIEVLSNFAKGWEGQIGVGLLTTTVENISNGKTTYDAEMGMAPHRSLNASLSYSHKFRSGVATLQGDTSFTAAQFQDVLNNPGLQLPSHTLLNFRTSYFPAKGRWEVAFWGKNMTNEAVPDLRYHLGFGSIISIYRPPRRVGADLTLHF